MCAAVQIKDFYPYEQKYENGILSYRVMSGQKAYYLDRDTINDEGPVTKLMLPAESFVSKCDFQTGPQKEIDIPSVFHNLKESLSSIYSDEQDFEKTLTTVFILSTYTYQVFDGLPNLWFYLPRYHQRPIVEKLLRNLCFNGIAVTNNYTPEAVTACIGRLDPTLIFQQYSRSKSNRLELIYSIPNTRDNFLPTEDLEVIELYCPKIILSSLLPQPNNQNHSIPIIVNKAPQGPAIESDYAPIRANLLLTALCIQKQLVETLSAAQTHRDLFSPIIAMVKTLKALNVMTEDELTSFTNALTDKKKILDRSDQISYVNDVLFGISEYLNQLNPQLSNDFVSLSSIIEFLHEIETVGLDMDARLLSRFLNRFQLIQGRPKRNRVQTGTSFSQSLNQANTALYIQKTFVKIDKHRLKQLTYTDLIYQQQ